MVVLLQIRQKWKQMKNSIACMIVLFCCQSLAAQDTVVAAKKFSVTGYLKGLETYTIDKLNHNNTWGSLLHNRINTKWKPNDHLSWVAEFRNRVFWGEQLKQYPDFAALLKNPGENWNLQKAWVNNRNLVIHTNIERLYVDLKNDKWSARLGRQRINWGMATTWNPNDIFNAYNFLDVDYEERPGSDALNLQYRLSDFSHIEAVYSSGGKGKQIAAARYFLNKWNYDMQLIAGTYQGAATIGAGWAGSIKETGFKGEMQYYFADKDSAAQFNLTIAFDHMFKGGWYTSLGVLYNSLGLNSNISNAGELNLNLSAKNLMPARFSYLVSVRKEITPLSAISCTAIYSPKLNLLIFSPGISYNISSQLDADLIWQSFFLHYQNSFQGIRDIGYLRLKWSFGW